MHLMYSTSIHPYLKELIQQLLCEQTLTSVRLLVQHRTGYAAIPVTMSAAELIVGAAVLNIATACCAVSATFLSDRKARQRSKKTVRGVARDSLEQGAATSATQDSDAGVTTVTPAIAVSENLHNTNLLCSTSANFDDDLANDDFDCADSATPGATIASASAETHLAPPFNPSPVSQLVSRSPVSILPCNTPISAAGSTGGLVPYREKYGAENPFGAASLSDGATHFTQSTEQYPHKNWINSTNWGVGPNTAVNVESVSIPYNMLSKEQSTEWRDFIDPSLSLAPNSSPFARRTIPGVRPNAETGFIPTTVPHATESMFTTSAQGGLLYTPHGSLHDELSAPVIIPTPSIPPGSSLGATADPPDQNTDGSGVRAPSPSDDERLGAFNGAGLSNSKYRLKVQDLLAKKVPLPPPEMVVRNKRLMRALPRCEHARMMVWMNTERIGANTHPPGASN